MVKLVNRAKMTTASTGTGSPINLGSASDGYQSFADAGASTGDVLRYTIEDGSSNFEIGTGTFNSAGTLTRTVSESSNSGNAIDLSGNAVVFVTAAASDIPTGTSLTKTFVQNEEATITLANAVSPAPTIGVFKEIPQVGITSKGTWDVDSTASNYDRLDEAPTSYSSKTITPSNASADGTFSLSSGSIASADVGKTVEGNGGKAVITATNGSYHLVTAFTNTNAIAAGSWGLFGAVANSDGSGLSLSTTPASGYDLANDVMSTTNKKALTTANFGVDATYNLSVEIAGNGSFVYVVQEVGTNTYIHQTALTSAFDLTSNGTKYTFNLGLVYGAATCFNSDGSAFYAIGRTSTGQGRSLKKWTLTSDYDLSTASADGSVSLNSSAKNGIGLADDETFLITTGTSNQNLIKYTFDNGAGNISSVTASSVITPSSTYTNFPSSGFGIGGLKLMDSGTKLLFKNYSSMGDYYLVNLTNANDITAGTYVSTTGDIGSYQGYSYGFGVKPDGTKLYQFNPTASNQSTGDLVEIGIGSAPVFPASTYFPSVTDASGQINSASWTDINSMTADEAAGNGTVNYAVSVDNRTIWKIAHNTSGIRSIVKNNSGTWQYNSNSTYGSETWTNSTTNSELAALQQALSVSQNRMNKAQLDAVADGNHFPLGNTLDLMIAVQMASGTTAPKSDGVSINYDAAALNRQAINGTDYEAEFPSTTSVKIKSLAAQNLKVRVL
jgi:hypothetical protein